MNYKEDALWQRIEAFKLDEDGAQQPFTKKLLQENKWSPEFAERAIKEYKKFIYLCTIFPYGASPSPIVDQVWHLHLTYTKSYWFDFCQNILQVNIHHNPSTGGIDEINKHREWYRQTCSDYEKVFGTKPPDDIWGTPKPIIEPRESLFKSPVKTLILICTAAVAYFIAPVFLAFMVVGVIVYELTRFNYGKGNNDGGCGTGCSGGCSSGCNSGCGGGGCGGCGGGD